MIEGLEISNSDTSLVFATAAYDVEDEATKRRETLKEALEGIYNFSSTKGLPSLQLTDTKEVLEYKALWARCQLDS
ncbi:hypothetical protein [Streptococcus cuniculi]|uniref:Uncharacterized protein n=1 Tax=Streptococcus cuniculi TaxID=1432788 RepID=A0A4Y9J7W9_9STRE|nr:hypothetical protein [Streptococcus cuniculi]MBF0778972.1 hypothetical protein [Streptococcus cuniculi]TFU97123.1 hypothetical protein E4T82_09595 [Streptococcus cuniculi]